MALALERIGWSNATFWPAGVARDGKMRKTAPTEAVEYMLPRGREGKMKTVAYSVLLLLLMYQFRRLLASL